MFAIKTTAGLYTEYVHSVRTQGVIDMPAKKSTSKIADEVSKEAAFKSEFVTNRINKQETMTSFDLVGDITSSFLRRVHNHALNKEADSRIALLKKASVDLGEF